jgi:hypothetical protein
MSFIILVNHSGGYVRNISSCVRLASDVDLEIFDTEDVFKVQEKVNEVLSNVFFAGCRNFSN